MARKKREEQESAAGGWINTFADLMNLLLCFFVLLFSMSTVDADKYEALVTSMSESINIFDGGGDAIGEGVFVSSGTDQLVSISQYFNEFEESGNDQNASNKQDSKQDNNKKSDSEVTNGADGTKTETGNDETTEQEWKEKFEKQQFEEQKQKAEQLYGEVVSAAQKKNIEDDITINMDKKYQYVQISLNGSILFDSGSASLKKSVLPLLSKVGDILQLYDSHRIKIEGHTDNVRIANAQYRNNTWLSTARALEVFEYLKNHKSMDPSTMEPTGCGEYSPVTSNKTAKGRARNRRVELKIFTK